MIHLVTPNPAVDRTILLENFSEGIPNRPTEVRDYPGGKGFNVAYAITRQPLEEGVMVHAMLGGENGQRVQSLAEAAGYNVLMTSVDQNTRECQIIVDTVTREVYPIYERGFVLDEATLAQFTDNLIGSIREGDTVVFSGSLMQGMPADYINQVYHAVKDLGVEFAVDTSGDALKSVYSEQIASIIKINDEEYNELFGIELETPAEFIDHLKTHGTEVPIFIVTLGSRGAVGKIHDQYIYMRGDKVDAKNPICSGDYFLGGLLYGYKSEGLRPEILKLAMSYAAVNVAYWFPTIVLDEAEVYRRSIHVQEM